MEEPLIVIVGQTASGKSALAMQLAERLDGELICADSRTVYRDLSIGAAKPTVAEQAAVPHHLLDLLPLDGFLNGRGFAALADQTIADIRGRGRRPIVVGGTRLYLDVLLHRVDWQPLDAAEQRMLAEAPLEEIRQRFVDSGTALPLNHLDRAAMIEALDRNRVAAIGPARRPAILLSPALAPGQLVGRVRQRIEAMLADGLEREVREICQHGNRSAASLNSIGYEEWQPYFDGLAGLADVANEIERNTLAYADLQAKWLSKQNRLQVVDSPAEALQVIAAC